MQEKIKFIYKTTLIAIVIVSFVYRKVLDGFFQQDEWLAFSHHIYLRFGGIKSILYDALIPSVGHYQPLNTLTISALIYLFGTNYAFYAVVSILLHLVNVYLAFKVFSYLFPSKKIALIASLLFGISASTYQATSWVMADIGIHLATAFAILSLFYFVKFTKEEDSRLFKKSLVLLSVSLMFKEIALGMLASYLLVYYLVGSKRLIKQKRFPTLLVVFGIFYVSFRVSMIVLFPNVHSRDAIKGHTQPLSYMVYNVITFPVKGVTQTLVPSHVLVNLSYKLSDIMPAKVTGEPGSFEQVAFVEKKVLESLSFATFFVLAGLILVLHKKEASINLKLVLLGLALILPNAPIYALSPERVGQIFIIDSRNLYLMSVGGAVLTTALILLLFKSKPKYATAALIAIVIINIYWLNKSLDDLSNTGSLRKRILNSITYNYPTMKPKAVLYSESDKAYYGLPENEEILPFQSGLGKTLLVWYHEKEKYPVEFYNDKFLWDITSQGYKEARGRGFGYFMDFDLLAKSLLENSLGIDSVTAFRYDSKTEKLADITDEIKGRLEGFYSKKKQVVVSSDQLTASEENFKVLKMLDKNRETYWSSKSPYINRHTLQVAFGRSTKVVQITIDTYNNKDQNQVGFKVYVSSDDKTWEQVFYSQKYPPDKKGIIDIYIKPVASKYLKIEQVGQHKYAPWVVHEMTIYEAQ